MPAIRLTERVCSTPFTEAKVNREAGYIDDVLICGLVSRNGNDYPDAVHARDHKVYEGAMVNSDHGREDNVDRRLGWFSNVTHKPGSGSRGRFNMLKSHPLYERVMEAAERNPRLYGFSHVADCKYANIAGRKIIESLSTIVSVDLVADPATTKGFFESTNAMNKISLKQFAEKFGPKWGPKKWGAFTTLCEEMGDIAEMPVMDEPDADAAPEGDLKEALMAALAPMLEEAFESGDATKVMSALKDFIKLHAKHTGKAAADAPVVDDTTAEESRKNTGVLNVIRECAAEGYTASVTELEMMLPLTAEKRKAFILEQKSKRPGERTQSAERRPGAGATGTIKESKTTAPVPTNGADFAKSLRA